MPVSTTERAPRDGDLSRLVHEFVPLNRRRVRGDPLGAAELVRWRELRDQLADALGASPPASGERRRALRVRTHLKLLVTTSVAQDLLHAHDLSEGGVFVRTQRPSPPGTSLHIELQDRDGRSVELEGTVAWVRRAADGRGPAGMGVAFHALSDWDRMLLDERVESALASL